MKRIFFLLSLGILLRCVAPEPVLPGAELKRFAYVANLMSHTLSVIDLDGPDEVRNLDIGPYPVFSALHPTDPTKLIVALHNYDRRDDDDALILFDLDKEKVIKKVPFPGAGMPSGFVYDPKRNRIYIADENMHRVYAVDAITLDPIFDLPAGLVPVHVDISPDARWLVVTNRKSADLYVYDLDNIEKSAKDGICSIHLGLTPDLKWDPEESNAGTYSHPVDVKFGKESNLCYVTDYNRRQLLFVDILKREVVAQVMFRDSPFDFTLNRERTIAYVCHVGGESVSIVDLKQRKIPAEITGLKSNPIHCELDEDRNQLVVACWGGARESAVYLVDLKTYAIQKHFPLKGSAASIGITIVRK